MSNIEFKDIKYFVLTVTFFVTAVITFFSINYRLDMPVSTTMDASNLPVVVMKTQNGTLFNELHGYTHEIDASLINESVTPLPDDKKLNIVINHYSDNVKKLSYKIRKLDDMSLIEDTTVSNYNAGDESNVNAELNIKNLIENDIEYLLEINLVTDQQDKISYYTKIISSANLGLQNKIDFVMNFNGWTYDSSKLDNISKYTEINKSADNSNYGKVNIYSSKTQIGWGELNAKVEKTIIPTIKEINSEIASIDLSYKMVAQNVTGYYDSYNVKEYYRVRQTSSAMYLLNFEREANQIFDSINDLTKSSKIYLGITGDEAVDMKSSSKGNYAYFVNQGDLWGFYDKEKAFTKVFSFQAEDSDNVRELYDKHNIKIMDVDDSGNVNFIVYGYMNRGAHEGEVGVSLCNYNYDSNTVEELLYIPVNVPYDVLQENVGKVAYISTNHIFYILLNNSLYSIDLSSKEVMVEVTGLIDETFAVSDDGTSIAYSLNGKPNDTDAVRIFNMSSGSDYQIRADEGDKLKVLGYIKNDCIIGYAHKSDILVEVNGSITFPMYNLKILDSGFNVVKEYQNEGVYVSGATVSGMRINLTRIIKNGEGNYESTAIDQLMNREENQATNGLSVETGTTDARKKELYINLVNKLYNLDNISTRTSKEIVFVSSKVVTIDLKFNDTGRYFVYGFGKFQGSFSNLANAVLMANETYGTVIDSKVNYVWKRYKSSNASINKNYSGGVGNDQSLAQAVNLLMKHAGLDIDAGAKLAQGMTAIDIINEATGNNALNLKGVTVENILYYINVGIPVIGRTGDDSYVLITAYDSKNITYFDVPSGKVVTVLTTEASKLFTQWGNVFIAYKGK